jgi:hypothetical protein
VKGKFIRIHQPQEVLNESLALGITAGSRSLAQAGGGFVLESHQDDGGSISAAAGDGVAGDGPGVLQRQVVRQKLQLHKTFSTTYKRHFGKH